MARLKKILLFMTLTVLVSSCREPFMPDFESGVNDYLVVEGFINVGQKAVTSITLSRIAPLMSAHQVFETNATLTIENKNGNQYPVFEKGNGIYRSDSLNLSLTDEYRLLITTTNGNQYASGFIKPKTTPAIDSIHWQLEDAGIQIYVTAHDDEANTHYYKWRYDETWEINSEYVSKYAYISSSGEFEKRSFPQISNLYYCWKNASSEGLYFASTTQFENDRIQYPIIQLPYTSDRTSVKYSILMEQRALTKEEFDYLQLIEKNSTVTGSLFDPMPSEIRGNIQSLSTPGEQVIGYIGAYTVQTKRVFISAAEIGITPDALCGGPIDFYDEEFGTYFGSGLYIPVDSTTQVPDELSFSGAPVYCMDCKARGGIPGRPDFWE